MDPDEAASGKRRSPSQRIGERGELEFRNFSDRQGLLCTRVEEDYGIDFMFQVDLDHKSRKASDIANTFAGACVRATQRADGRVVLSRRDAANLLNSRSPIAFVLVVTGDQPVASAIVYHRLVDETFMIELQNFIESDKESLSVYPSHCRTEDSFPESLRLLISVGFTERVRLNNAQSRLQTILPQTSVEIRRMADGELTLVTTVDYFSLFDSSGLENENRVLRAAFGADRHFIERLTELAPRPELAKYLRRLPEPTVLAGYTEEADLKLTVSNHGDMATETFIYRRIGTHFAYVHRHGISLITSKAREKGGQWVHETELFVDPLIEIPCEDLGSLLDFLTLCESGATLTVPTDDSDGPDLCFEVDEYYPSLMALARFVDSWRQCVSVKDWPLRKVALRDANDPEIFNTLAGFASLLAQPTIVRSMSFVVQSLDDPLSLDSLAENEVIAELPVIGNLSEGTVVLWLQVASFVLSSGVEVVGLRFDRILGARAEFRDLAVKTSQYPEMVLGPNAPTAAFSPQRTEGVLAEGLGDVELRWTETQESQ